MVKKIELLNNALIVTDTVTGKIELNVPKSKYYYRHDFLERDIIKLVPFDSAADVYEQQFPVIPLSEAIDSADQPFTKNSFEVFATTNLGN